MDRRAFLKLAAISAMRWPGAEDFRPSGCWMSEELEQDNRVWVRPGAFLRIMGNPPLSRLIGSPEKLSAMARCLDLPRQARVGGEGNGVPVYYLYHHEREHAIAAGVNLCENWHQYRETLERIEIAYGTNAETWEKCP